MKNIIIRLILTPILFFSIQAKAQFHFGARAGNNLSDMIMEDLRGQSRVDKAINRTFHIGGILEYDITKQSDILCLESGLFLSWKGTKLEYGSFLNTETITPIYLEIPINALYNTDFGPNKFQIYLGPYIGFGIAGKIKYGVNNVSSPIKFGKSGDMKVYDFGLNMGAGIRMDDILMRLQYGYGLTNLDTSGSSTQEMKNRVIGISIGCMFGKE